MKGNRMLKGGPERNALRWMGVTRGGHPGEREWRNGDEGKQILRKTEE